MTFFVVLADGRKFGPADVPTLNEWIKENRLTPDTILEEELSGGRQKASELRGLDFGAAPPPPAVRQHRSAEPNPIDPLSQMEQSPAPQSPRPTTASDQRFANPPGLVSNYPRGVSVQYTGGEIPTEFRGGFNWGAFWCGWIWGLNHKAYYTFLIFLVLPFYGWANISGDGNWVLLMFVLWLGAKVGIGLKGNPAAWKSGRFSSIEDCRACQNIWRAWAIALFVLWLIPIVAAIIFPVIAQSRR